MKDCLYRSITTIFVILFATAAGAQRLDTRQKVDTLTLADRIALRTNAFDWLLTIPNFGVEFDLGNKNYSRWTLGVDGRINWQTRHTYQPGVVFNIAGVRLQARNYWRMRRLGTRQDDGVPPHTTKLGRLFSKRDSVVKHPTTTYFLGAYAAYDKVSLMPLFKYGYQGNVISAGVTMGIVRPLYEFANGNTLDLEIGGYAGLAHLSYDKYDLDREDNCYQTLFRGGKKIMPIVHDISISLVYRLGKKPVTHKYRWRFDCDADYKEAVYAGYDLYTRVLGEEHRVDTLLTGLYQREFKAVYDSVHARNIKRNDSIATARRQREADIKMKQEKAKTLVESRQTPAPEEEKSAATTTVATEEKKAGDMPTAADGKEPEEGQKGGSDEQ